MADNGKERRPLTQSEKFKNYCLGIAALTALILGLINILKGEPTAEKTWETLRKAVNEQASAINKLKSRLVYFQAVQEARTASEIQHKLDTLQDKYDALLAKKSVQAKLTPTPQSKPVKKECREGAVLGTDNRCHRVGKTVATKVKEEKQLALRALEAEKKKRLEAERRKKALMKKLQHAEQAPPMPAKRMRILPKSLKDAADPMGGLEL